MPAPCTSGRAAALAAPPSRGQALQRGGARQQRREWRAAGMGIGFTPAPSAEAEGTLLPGCSELVVPPPSVDYGLSVKQMKVMGLTNDAWASLPEVKAVSGCGRGGWVGGWWCRGWWRWWWCSKQGGRGGMGRRRDRVPPPPPACLRHHVSPPLPALPLPCLQEALTARAHYVHESVQCATRTPVRMGQDQKPPGRAPPDLPSLLLDARIVYIGMPVGVVWRVGGGESAYSVGARRVGAAAARARRLTPPHTSPPPPHSRARSQLVPQVTELVVSELLYLNYTGPEKPVYVYINSTGGEGGC